MLSQIGELSQQRVNHGARHGLATTSVIKRVGSRTRTRIRRACNDQQLAQALIRRKTSQDEDSLTVELEYHLAAD